MDTKIFNKVLTNPQTYAIIRPSKGDDPVGKGERERAGRGGSQSQKLRRLGAATEAWRALKRGQAPWSVPSPTGDGRETLKLWRRGGNPSRPEEMRGAIARSQGAGAPYFFFASGPARPICNKIVTKLSLDL